ncbi:MAG: YdbH domain-containing protein [Puniceicoccaceae bacterium]
MNIAWNRFGPWFWVPLLVVLGALFAWQLFRLLPQWVEGKIGESLLESGIVATALTVERVAPSETLLGPSTLVYGPHVLNWEALEAQYSLGAIYSGRVDHLHVEKPHITLQFLPPAPGLPEPPPELLPEQVATAPAPSPAEPVASQPSAEPAPSGTVARIERPAVVLPGLRERLLDIPLDGFSTSEGVVEILVQENPVPGFTFGGQMSRQPFGLSGELYLESEDILAQLSLRVPKARELVTFQGEAILRREGLGLLAGAWLPYIPRGGEFPRILSSGRLVMDALLEIPSAASPYGSLEATMDELLLEVPSSPLQLQLNDLLLAGTLQEDVVRLQGGAEVQFAGPENLFVEPFAIRFTHEPGGAGTIETEAFHWNYGSLSALTALRGFLHEEDAGLHLRTEIAFSEFLTPYFQMEPFSLLVQGAGSRYSLVASPSGLKRSGTIWLEQLQADWDGTQHKGSAGMEVFGLSGGPMGSVVATVNAAPTEALEVAIDLLNPAGEGFLSGFLNKANRTIDAGLNGTASLAWINEFLKWSSMGDVQFDGPDPEIDFSLSGKSPFFSGDFLISMNGASAWLSEDLRAEGLRGDSTLEIRSLPRTRGLQTLTADLLSSGQLVLSDLELDWELPTFRTLAVRRLEAWIGEGRVRVRPFTMDPMEPRIRTVLEFQGLSGNELLRWLGEERFQIEGAVSGQLAIGWDNGALVLGKGLIHLDEGQQRGRFIFADPDFLKERFAAFGGVPAELKQRFLDTLQQQGIHITSLSAELREADKPDHFLLRIAVSGESRTELLEVPIEGLVINNIISANDLGYLLGLLGPIQIEAQ